MYNDNRTEGTDAFDVAWLQAGEVFEAALEQGATEHDADRDAREYYIGELARLNSKSE